MEEVELDQYNNDLGFFRDNLDLLDKAKKYLENFSNGIKLDS